MANKKTTTKEESVELQELKRLKAVFHSPEGELILKSWIREYVLVINRDLNPVVEGSRAFVLELMKDIDTDLDAYFDDI